METFSMNVISKTLTAQSEMIAPGVMGINFMKPEKPVNTMSDVYRLVQEEEQNKVKSPTPMGGATPFFKQTKLPPSMGPRPPVKIPPSAPMPVPVAAPAPAFAAAPPPMPTPVAAPPPNVETPSQGPCTDCGRIIVGPFVTLSDRILHDDCFKCSTCGASLRNVGFHNISNKLYCETHAVLAARVVASNAVPIEDGYAPVAAPHVQPVAPPIPAPCVAPILPVIPAVVPKLPTSTVQSGPTPFGQQRLPRTPSSSGDLTFRSISPQPFKRISGDFHKVAPPVSPTHGSSPVSPLAYSSGPLPFESKPYMPPDQPMSTLFSSHSDVSHSMSEISQTSHSVQRTTQVTQHITAHSQQMQHVDFKQYTSGQSRKFVWPPPKSDFEVDASSPLQNVSPLVSQSLPACPLQNDTGLSSHQTLVQQEKVVKQDIHHEATGISDFAVPPLPTTFAEPAVVTMENSIAETQASVEAKKEQLTTLAAVGPQATHFAPSLPPVADARPTAVPTQSGVPSGAGARAAPRKGRGQLMREQTPGRLAVCGDCGEPIRGPFIIALNRTWCPEHFHCNNAHCKSALIDIGFVEEQGQLYCEQCYEAFLAPVCAKCSVRIKGDCLNALDKQWHPACFICAYCSKPFGNTSFYLEDGLPYCEKDWNELFTTKCIACGFPIEAGDRWVEALNNNYHSQCFKCSSCQKNLEGQSFYAKGGKPYCKQHAR